MRLFFAIDLDDHARAAVARASASLARETAGLGASIRWSNPAGLHVTLAFLGEVTDDRLPALETAGSTPFRHSVFELSLSRVGIFPAVGMPRVIWMGPGRGAEDVRGLARSLWRRLDVAGCGPAPARFEPHVTLGRVRRARAGAARRLRGRLAGLTALPETAWTVERVSFYESRLGSDGATYRRLAAAALRGGAP